jgi:hypothetical protein
MATSKPHDGETRDEGGFLSRWSRRKVQLRQGVVVGEPAAAPQALVQPVLVPPGPAPRQAAGSGDASGTPAPAPTAAEPATEPAPTLADVAALTAESDYSRFVAPGVEGGVKNAALKKLFTDPHFNIMDGLDTYIDDYGQPDPLPAGMLRQMAQSHALGLFADDPPPAAAGETQSTAAALPADGPPADSLPPSPATAWPHPPTPPSPTPDEDAALRLQPHDAAGPAGPGAGTEPHTGRPH